MIEQTQTQDTETPEVDPAAADAAESAPAAEDGGNAPDAPADPE